MTLSLSEKVILTIFGRLLRDADHFNTQMSKLDGSDDLGSYLYKLVEAKQIASTEPEVATTNGNGSNGAEENSVATSPVAPAAEEIGSSEGQTETTTGSSDS